MKEYMIQVNSKSGTWVISGYGISEKPKIGEDAKLIFTFVEGNWTTEVYESRNTITYIKKKENP